MKFLVQVYKLKVSINGKFVKKNNLFTLYEMSMFIYKIRLYLSGRCLLFKFIMYKMSVFFCYFANLTAFGRPYVEMLTALYQ